MNAWQLDGNGYGNTYYAAAVRSMSLSWKNFFFGAFDPGGFITVDKPPVFLWMGALSVRIFGYSSWALLLPRAIAGATTVALVWLIVRRYFGVAAATVAGVVLALTPITVAVDRLNLPEPFFILALVGAAGATLRSLESKRWWLWVAAAGVLVGIAFNTKMLAGWIPGPALALALVAGHGSGWRDAARRLHPRHALHAPATFSVSFSWMLIVDGWPASSRPYVGGSTDNTVSNLALDYNGLGRVDGQEGNRGGGNRGAAPAGQRPTNGAAPRNGGTFPQPGGNFGFGGRGGSPTGGAPNNATGAGGIIAGSPGWLRMFDSANGGQIAWFLPFALLGGLLCLWEWRRNRVRRAATVLFLGWVVLFGGVFSYAQGTYHSYYTSALAPGIAVLVGMTVFAGVTMIRRNPRWLLPVAAIVAATLWVQLTLAGRFPDFQGQVRPFAIALVIAGGAAILVSALSRRLLTSSAAMGVIMTGLLLMPASWATYETFNPSLNTTLPQAGPRAGISGRSFGSANFDDGTTALAAWLEAHSEPNTRWDLAVSSAQNASTLIAEHNLSVMALGGFLGSDPTNTVSQFASLVDKGEVRYVLTTGGFGGFGGGVTRGGFGGFGGGATRGGFGSFPGTQQGGQFSNPATRRGTFPGQAPTGQPSTSSASTSTAKGAAVVMSAVEATCKAVTDTSLPTQYQGAIYDCSGAGAALRAAG
jgi:4-amino-4-deoxy-L-arabinose transferase-like glycosyltransferase